MGYMRHHAIIVSTSDEKFAAEALKQALEIFGDNGQVGPPMKSPVNKYSTFLIGPDGSKESWTDSEDGDSCRAAMIAWLDNKRYDDGSSPLEWVEIQYGDEMGETVIVSHSDEKDRMQAGCL